MNKDAAQSITDIGQRPTAARSAVLGVLMSAEGAISHTEIIERMSAGYQFDRVTIYRVLEWLTDHHLIHRIASEDRAWKFQVSHHGTSHQHAHLQCTQCKKTVCLDEIEPSLPAQITSQFKVESVDMIIKGRCADCTE
jgi:Fur family ferric uptake transcriptional regulator